MSNELRIIIAGSREFNDYTKLNTTVNKIISNSGVEIKNVRIVSGTAKGADRLGELYAQRNNILLTKMPADWDNLGKRAGYVRNDDMAKFATEDGNTGVLIAFWDGESRGTKHMIDLATKRGLIVHLILGID